jgi:hypothetical protein
LQSLRPHSIEEVLEVESCEASYFPVIAVKSSPVFSRMIDLVFNYTLFNDAVSAARFLKCCLGIYLKLLSKTMKVSI